MTYSSNPYGYSEEEENEESSALGELMKASGIASLGAGGTMGSQIAKRAKEMQNAYGVSYAEGLKRTATELAKDAATATSVLLRKDRV